MRVMVKTEADRLRCKQEMFKDVSVSVLYCLVQTEISSRPEPIIITPLIQSTDGMQKSLVHISIEIFLSLLQRAAYDVT